MKRSWHGRRLGIVVSMLLAPALVCAPAAFARDGLKAKITRSAHGIPNIEADDYKSLGYGYGYAFAQDNICSAADSYLTVRAQRSRYFGADAQSLEGFANLDSDFFFERIIQDKVVEKLIAQKPPLGPKAYVEQTVKGYVKGYNRYLADTGVKNIPDPRCAGAPWVKKIRPIDAYRRFYELALYASSGAAIDGIATAQPPAAARPVSAPTSAQVQRLGEALDFSADGGSNGWGLGSQATKSGGGIVLINPHFPWQGPRRLYQANLSIPGKLHASGASLYGVPAILVGHTENLSWMHPVSPAYRFTPFELDLAPGDPTSYLVDGQAVPMERDTLTVDVLQPDGSVTRQSRTLYSTSYGPVFTRIQGQSIFTWTNERAYALFDANAGNIGRLMNHFFDVNRAQTTNEMLRTLRKYEGIPWVHTVASDSRGKALYADIGSIPNVPNEKAQGCSGDLGALTFPAVGLPVLDGSRSECALTRGEKAADDGLIGDRALPHLFRRDYVANMNDSYWLTNPKQPLEGFDRIVGAERTQRSLRTRLGLIMIQQRLAGEDGLKGKKFTLNQVKQLVFQNRHYLGELWRDELVGYCNAHPTMQGSSGPVDVSAGCAALAAWDLKVNLDSRGALLFVRFVDRFGTGANRFATPFDVNNPIHTPAGLNTSNEAALEQAFADAVTDLRAANIPLDAPYADFHWEMRDDERIPIHGGEGAQGVFNAISDRWTPGVGYDDVVGGSSFVMVTSFEGGCPKDRSITTYSQSENPQSKYFADQTRMYSDKKWVDPPFCAKQVRKAAIDVKVLRGK